MRAARTVLLAAVLLALLPAEGAYAAPRVVLEAPYPARVQLAAFREPAAARPLRNTAAVSWWGGTYVATSGESVRIAVSTAYPVDDAVARGWAEFFTGLVHGSELAHVNVFLAPADEVSELCGADALGCYGAQTLVSIGDSEAGVAPALVAAHEYGHHVAYNRVNTPWRAIDWGTKRWASALGICSRAAAGTVFPGDEGDRYELNPGEGFAESYRVLNEALDGRASFEWPIVDASFFPDERARAAVEEDVLRPWTAPATGSATGRFPAAAGRSVWQLHVRTPYDGELALSLRMPAEATHELSLVDDRGAVVGRGLWSGVGAKTLRHTICGQRSLRVRVTGGGPSRFTVRWSRP